MNGERGSRETPSLFSCPFLSCKIFSSFPQDVRFLDFGARNFASSSTSERGRILDGDDTFQTFTSLSRPAWASGLQARRSFSTQNHQNHKSPIGERPKGKNPEPLRQGDHPGAGDAPSLCTLNSMSGLFKLDLGVRGKIANFAPAFPLSGKPGQRGISLLKPIFTELLYDSGK